MEAAVIVDDSGNVIENPRAELSLHIARDIVLPLIRTFETDASAVETAALAFENDPTNTTKQADVKAAFATAMTTWQRLEVMQFGPQGVSTSAAGGQDIRDEIYSWPLVNLCSIDQEIIAEGYASTDVLAAKAVNVRGLGAIEYLLFNTSTATTCTAVAQMNAWAALTAPEVSARRAHYVRAIATLVKAQATRLRTAWEPTGGNFVHAFEVIGTNASPYTNVNHALNNITDAMFYVYSVTRDVKVGIPTGIDPLCSNPPCANNVEARFSDASISYIRENLVAFRTLFLGGEPGGSDLGFDDLLVSIGQQALATNLLTEVNEAIALCDGFTAPLEDVLFSNPTQAEDLYHALKDISTILKTQFTAVLDLQLPTTAAGDND
jgi:predicted lipoprotein